MKPMNYLLLSLMCVTLLLTACTSAPAANPAITTPSETPSASTTPAATPAATKVQDDTAASTSSSLSNNPTQTGDYRSGNTLQIPITITSSGFNPKILTVGYGDRVSFTLSNEDSTTRTFNIEAYNIAKTLAPDDTIVIDFYAIIKGEFKYDDTYSTNDGTLIVGGKT